MIEIPGEHDRLMFADLTPDQFSKGMDWLSHEPVSYEAAMKQEDVQNWIALVAATPEQISDLRQVLVGAG